MNEAFCMMGGGVGGFMTPGGWQPEALTSLMSPLNTTSSALRRSIFSFISSWMASASCAAYKGRRPGRGQGGLGGLPDAGQRGQTPALEPQMDA